ncbi:hypothetical protein P153DRAFT_13180 [Dothidotthia symphoricarpi CBS 119687]|uniref:Uncharacterized protein n=1 Tax=Dothidotthia symphoricarpi CBS 119687 TaxID=1392245 RepID=A0A6A6ASH4_9PLEO|nr:uncharacterized protein P153DRAFT_13180 [Dothidotthia symphoricarpi CBS 119687]KAF2134952.1 hypothetical protein P153DRAFT_13180 [Dothidotthia symphoricarpi CBS 119687]
MGPRRHLALAVTPNLVSQFRHTRYLKQGRPSREVSVSANFVFDLVFDLSLPFRICSITTCLPNLSELLGVHVLANIHTTVVCRSAYFILLFPLFSENQLTLHRGRFHGHHEVDECDVRRVRLFDKNIFDDGQTKTKTLWSHMCHIKKHCCQTDITPAIPDLTSSTYCSEIRLRKYVRACQFLKR